MFAGAISANNLFKKREMDPQNHSPVLVECNRLDVSICFHFNFFYFSFYKSVFVEVFKDFLKHSPSFSRRNIVVIMS